MRVFCKCSAKIESKKFVSGVTILLSLTVFLNLVAETLPQVSDAIPLLGSKSYHYSSFCFELISYIFFVPRSFPHSVNVFHFTLGVLLVVGVFHFTFLSLSRSLSSISGSLFFLSVSYIF
jgi:Neurotransmitter-gated ion-channel transmembrane region